MERRVIAAALAVAALAGCGAGGEPSHPVRLAVRDMALREVGAECSGAIPYLYIHAGVQIEFDDGENPPIAIELPAGLADRGDTHDWGNSPRVPTNCNFVFDGSRLKSGTDYGITIGGKTESISWRYDLDQAIEGMPTVIIPGESVAADVIEDLGLVEEES